MTMVAGASDQSVPDMSLSELMKDDPRKLRTELEAAKKRQERIMAAFKKTSKEFRQAVYCLTGELPQLLLYFSSRTFDAVFCEIGKGMLR